MMRSLAAALLTLPLSAQSTEAQSTEFAIYDLSEFAFTHDREQVSNLTSWDDRFLDLETARPIGVATQQANVDYVLEVIDTVLGESLRVNADIQLMLRESHLLIAEASPAIHTRIRETLNHLRSYLFQEVQLEVQLVTWDGVPADGALPPSSMSPEEANAFIGEAQANGAEVKSWPAAVRAGRTTMLGSQRLIGYLADFDVEIANTSVIADPIIARIVAGDQIAIRLDSADGGHFLALSQRSVEPVGDMGQTRVDFQARMSEPLEPAAPNTRPTKGTTQPAMPTFVETPTVLNRTLVCESFLPSDRVISMSSAIDVAGVQKSQVLLVRHVEGELKGSSYFRDTSYQLLLFNLGRYAPMQLAFDWHLEGTSPNGFSTALMLTAKPQVTDWIVDLVAQGASRVSWNGPWLFTFSDAQGRERGATETFSTLQRLPRRRTVASVGLQLTGAARAYAQIPAAGTFGVVLEIGKSRVQDYDVEVAAAVSVGDPKIEHDFEGLRIRGSITEVEPETASVRLDGFARAARSPDRTVDLGDDLMGPLTFGEALFLSIDRRRSLRAGESLTVGLPGDNLGLSVSLD
ncbi:MAG: hypothetical protein WD226_12235 [Planctomycetota bacterium]